MSEAARSVIGDHTDRLSSEDDHDDCSAQPTSDTPQQLTAPITEAARRWRGWGSALKPSFEPIVMARKPLYRTLADNVLTYGTGALNIQDCRIGTSPRPTATSSGVVSSPNTSMSGPNYARNPGPTTIGRWPTNVVLDPSAADLLDTTAASRPSRFFPTFCYTPKAPTSERPIVGGVAHPTVKPLQLLRWLIRLVTPPHGLILDPFGGSGTTAEAAIHEHTRAILIEREPTYLPLIRARLSKPMQIGFDFHTDIDPEQAA